jgi:predicted acyl esterase
MADKYEMVVDQDIGIPMRDGAVLRANFYHP